MTEPEASEEELAALGRQLDEQDFAAALGDVPDMLRPRSLDEVWPVGVSAVEFVENAAPRMLDSTTITCKTSGRRWAVPSFDELPGVDLTPCPWWRRTLDRIRRRAR